MNNLNSRRDFLKKAALGSSVAMFPNILFGNNGTKSDYSLIDYHVHLTRYLKIEEAAECMKAKNMKFGVVEHPVNSTNLIDDESLLNYIENTHSYNALAGLQPFQPGWDNLFSSEVLDKLDYVLIDALEIPKEKGGYEKIWEQRFILYNKPTFMDRYIDFNLNVLENGKANILANPTFLPICLAPDYYKLWTESRMEKIIRYAIKNNVAFEINSVYQYPKKPFIQMAKEAGAKFSFGSNAHRLNEIQNYEYCYEMISECNLTKDDIFNATY